MKRRATLVTLLGLAMLAAASIFGAPAASAAPAATLRQVTDFGYNPTALQMWEYVPLSVTRHPAILVVLHYCGGSGPTMFRNTQYASLADQFGFIVIYPSVTRSFDCFDVSDAGALVHDGNSDPAGIVSMVELVEEQSDASAHRVFVTGLSSGAMMTNVLLGDYPDVFRAGSAYAGVPFGCFATTGGAQWNTSCANGQITRTAQEWGDLVRAAFPGYDGPRPRMQLWHGTADTTLFYTNLGEEIKQWTNVLGVSQTPTITDNPQPTWTHTTYARPSGRVVVDATSEAGITHNIAIQAASTVHFFGLDDPHGNGIGD